MLLLGCTTQNNIGLPDKEENEINLLSGNNPIVIGDVSTRVDEVTVFWQPLASYLADGLSEQGITHGLVRVAPDLNTMAQWLQSGEVDIYIDSSYPSSIVNLSSNSRPVLRHWRDFVSEYYSVFFTIKGNGITTLADLQGEIIAYDKPFSTSGYFLPTVYLVQNGFEVVEVDEPTSQVNPSAIGYTFANEDINIINWVITGHTNIGVTNNFEYAKIPEETRDRFFIIAQTDPIPNQLVSLSSDMEANLAQSIISLLTDMENSEAGKDVLEIIETERFDDLPAGSEAFSIQMTDMLSVIEEG